LQVSDIISLHQQGVSEPVINAMQNARIGSVQPIVVQQAPVVIQERYVVPQYGPPPVYHYHHHHRRPHYGY
jgi:hypothetical protein